MPDLTRDSDRLLTDARRVRDDNRAGGRHRRELPRSIGRESRRLKTGHLLGKLKRIVLAVVGIILAASVLGAVLDGLQFIGLMGTFLAVVAAVVVLSRYPKMKVPQRADLSKVADARQLVGRTELWLEAQRPALPAPAADMVGKIGVQLDALGVQLQGIDPAHPAAREVRSLVGESLPEMVDSYRRIPAHLRAEARAGGTPDDQLVGGLGRVSDEIERVTRQLAEGTLDDLAVKTRYLDYKYGEDVALPAPDRTKDIA